MASLGPHDHRRDGEMRASMSRVPHANGFRWTVMFGVQQRNAASEIDGAAFVLPVPEAPNPILAPLLSVVPGQLFAAALAQAKGLDADRPAGLTKVTRAR